MLCWRLVGTNVLHFVAFSSSFCLGSVSHFSLVLLSLSLRSLLFLFLSRSLFLSVSRSSCLRFLLSLVCSPPPAAMSEFYFNMDSGYFEGLVRGFRAGLLTRADYLNLCQCDTLEGTPTDHIICHHSCCTVPQHLQIIIAKQCARATRERRKERG